MFRSQLVRANRRLHASVYAALAHRRRGGMVETLENRLLLSNAPIVVNTTADPATWNPDDNVMSLREAIAQAATMPGDDKIELPAGTYPLAQGQFEISNATGNLTIESTGGVATLDAQHASRVFQVDAGVSADLRGIALVNGTANGGGIDGDGGAILNFGDTTLTECSVSDSSDIYSATLNGVASALNLTDCTLGSEQQIYLSSSGGSTELEMSGCTLKGSTLWGDANGGSVVLKLSDCTIEDTLSRDIAIRSSVSNGGHLIMQLDDCIVANNRAGIFLDSGNDCTAEIELTHSTFSGNIGGAITNNIYGGSAALKLSGCTFSDNAVSNGVGAAISNTVLFATLALDISHCTFNGNTALRGGGAIYNVLSRSDATIAIDDSDFIGNSGGGLSNAGGGAIFSEAESNSDVSLSLTNCTLDNNTADSGGAIYNLVFGGGSATVTFAGCTLNDNTAENFVSGGGGAIYSAVVGSGSIGALTLTDCTLSKNNGNYGGGIYNVSTDSLAIINCTFTQNVGAFGGGIYSVAYKDIKAELANCTFSSNGAFYWGGVIRNKSVSGTATVGFTECTMIRNRAGSSGGAIYNDAAGTMTLRNTIVAKDIAPAHKGPDVKGPFDQASSHNLIGVLDATSTGITAGVNGNVAGTPGAPLDPKLGSLADNGGPTLTIAPLPGSPVINAGDNSLVPAGVVTDQRGPGFDRFVGTVDMGAVENQSPILRDLTLSTNEDQEIVLSLFTFDGGFTDPEHDLLQAVRLDSLPTHGTLLLNGQLVASGQVLSRADLLSFKYQPNPNYSGSDLFTFSASDGISFAADATANIGIIAVADAPTLSVAPATGDEGSAIPLSIATALTDTDGSESLSIQLSNVPASATLSAGTNQGGGLWTLTPDQLSGLTLTNPDNAVFSLTVTAISTESSNGDSASTSALLNVTINNVAPAVHLNSYPTAPLYLTEQFALAASFTDPGIFDTHIATIDWGDGTIQTIDPATSPLNLTHAYDQSGDVAVSVTVTDNDGGSSTAACTLDVLTPQQAVKALLTNLNGVNLPHNVETSLGAKLTAADHRLGQNGNDTAVLAHLDAFIKGVNHWADKGLIDPTTQNELLMSAGLIEQSILSGAA